MNSNPNTGGGVKNNFISKVENSHNKMTASGSNSNEISNNFNTTINNIDNSIQIITTADGRQIIINNNHYFDNVTPTLIESSNSHTNLLQSTPSHEHVTSPVHSEVVITPVVDSSSLGHNLKHSISKVFDKNIFKKDRLTSRHYPLDNTFRISIKKYEDLLTGSYLLRKYIIENSCLIYDSKILTSLNNIIDDIKIFLNLQLRLEGLKLEGFAGIDQSLARNH
jgi:hypothetical protein